MLKRVASALLVGAIGVAPAWAQSTYCQPISVPGAAPGGTQAFGINNHGHIVGGYQTGDERWHAFLLVDGVYTTFDYPGATYTVARGINDAGQIVGDAYTSGFAGGFLLSGGQFSPISFPGPEGTVTQVWDINNGGTVAGSYHGPPDFRSHGFVAAQGIYTTIDYPGVAHTFAHGVNDNGVVVGTTGDVSGVLGFKLVGPQLIQTPRFPGSYATPTFAINNDGKIAGGYNVHRSPYGGAFVLSGSHFSGFNCPGAGQTTAYGINDRGALVGNYPDPGGQGSLSFYTHPVAMVDPVPDLLNGQVLTTDVQALAARGRSVQGIAADGVSRVVLRIPASSPGEQFTLTLLKQESPPVQGLSSDEDGALGTPADPCCENQLTVAAIDTSRGPFAFAVYRAPVDFARIDEPDAGLTFRDVFVRIEPANGPATTLPVRIVRPPVVLLHGLWSSAASFNGLTPLVNGTTTDPRFAILRIDYDRPTPITASVPAFSAAHRGRMRANSLGFDFNSRYVLQRIEQWMGVFKAIGNPARISIAAVQADIVAHSMGGDISRTIPLQARYLDRQTFGQGIIHKLITIDTPHLGSPLATRLLAADVGCLRDLLARYGNFALETATVSGRVERGAVGDLVPNSQALQDMAGAPPGRRVFAALLAGVYTNFGSLDFGNAFAIRNIACPSDPLADQLTDTGWPAIFGEENDAIVGITSQHNGQPGARVVGAMHSPGTAELGFTPPSVLHPGVYGDHIIFLLNRPYTDPTHFRLTP